ncbi:SIP domain-containing protein [Actinomadura syzygii]|uniref:Phage tail protein n=1 Tax=Actinomadura syzygii TaxID=1427538 RepID=A0A5D0TQE0_9ACTN|nr:siderophore-interacting protein [Actinomadura syzygii]TYC07620.1 phage tail protein [Actinomadura syzygii]
MPSRRARHVVTFPIVLRELTVLRVCDVTPGMRRVTLGGEQLGAFHRDGLDLPALRSDGFDDHVKFFFPAPGESRPVLPRQDISSLDWPADARPIAKDYTPRRFDPAAGEIDFDFVRHEGGPASDWAQRARPGQTAWIAGPKMSESHPVDAEWLLVLGDETALPAIGRWLEEMPDGTRAKVFIEVRDLAERQDLPTRADADIVWLSRDGAPAGTTGLLADAVRTMQWPPGTVFVWAAGEAGALKPVRRLLAERNLAREHTHITGYWRRTEPAPGGTEPGEDGEDVHERLHELTDLAPGYAIRAAVTLGLIDHLHAGAGEVAELAGLTGGAPSALRALLDYLASIDVVAAEPGGRYRLAPIGEELAEDDHSAEEYHADGVRAALDLALADLAETVRTGRAGYRRRNGVPLATLLERPTRMAEQARAVVEESALWVSPSVVSACDWTAVTSFTAAGNGAGAATNALLKAFPHLRARLTALPSALKAVKERVLDPAVLPRLELVSASNPLPQDGDDLLLLVNPFTWLPDDDAVHLLKATADLLPEPGRLLLVEQARTPDADDLLYDLQLRCAFGSGLRTPDEIGELAARAGLGATSVQEIGWHHHLWDLRPGDQHAALSSKANLS